MALNLKSLDEIVVKKFKKGNSATCVIFLLKLKNDQIFTKLIYVFLVINRQIYDNG